ncbi:MAG: ABC transporter ATP-binding protein [Burkholderiaceae bacterium]
MTARPLSLEVVGMSMQFGALTALDNVSVKIRPGTVHALLGENGAGKSTLVKCLMGFYQPNAGQVAVDGREVEIRDPHQAHALGLGMVYQHFTLAPSLTAAENLVVAGEQHKQLIDWQSERVRLDEFMSRMPFQIDLHTPVSDLSAGEKQKLEIIKQLYLGRRLLILDEPTSVLTPDEATEVLSLIHDMATDGNITVIMITHKFREVVSFADDVTVLRRGRLIGTLPVSETTPDQLAQMMVGESSLKPSASRDNAVMTDAPAQLLHLKAARARTINGTGEIFIESLAVNQHEIVGVAGVSGNGQVELMEVLTGQRPLKSGELLVQGQPYSATREQMIRHQVRYLPEEPLSNACAASMTVAENLALRSFDRDESGRQSFWLDATRLRRQANELIGQFRIKTSSADSPLVTLSGGNVQRCALARELTGDVSLLIVANPCFGLDFGAVRDIRSRLIAARNRGVGVLLISEDLDEIFELADRIVVMTEGSIQLEVDAAQADIQEIGRHMAGAHA